MATSLILGPDGRPVTKSDLDREIATVSQAGPRQPRLDIVSSGLTPARLATLLLQANAGDTEAYLTLAEEMEERELHYASVLQTRRLAVSGQPYIVESASDSPHDVELADAVRTYIRAAPGFIPLIEALLDALGKGISVVEILWDTTRIPWAPRRRWIEGKARPPYIWRDPRHFQWDLDTLEELRLRDQGLANGASLSPWKFIVHQSKLKQGLPGRAGLARLVAVTYMLKFFSMQDWVSFAEIFGRPWVIGRHSNVARKEDINVLRLALECLGQDARAILPDSLRLEFQEAVNASGGGDLYKNLLEWLDKQISKAVLGQTTSADETAGRLGGAQEKETIRQDRILADYRQLISTLNEQLIEPFITLNWGLQPAYPRFSDELPREEDKMSLVTALKELVPLGLKVETSVIRDKFGLPDPSPDAELLGVQNIAPVAPTSSIQGKPALNRAGGTLTADQSDAELDLMMMDALAGWEKQLAPIVNPALSLAQNSASYDEFLSGLPGLLNEMSPGELVQSLAQATFKARGLGEKQQ